MNEQDPVDSADVKTPSPEMANETSSASHDEAVVDLTDGEPTVDALEDQLGRLQGAMDKLQQGDLDGAERTIEALEADLSSLKS